MGGVPEGTHRGGAGGGGDVDLDDHPGEGGGRSGQRGRRWALEDGEQRQEKPQRPAFAAPLPGLGLQLLSQPRKKRGGEPRQGAGGRAGDQLGRRVLMMGPQNQQGKAYTPTHTTHLLQPPEARHSGYSVPLGRNNGERMQEIHCI